VTEGVLGDPARLEALRRTALLDTPPEEPFDRLTRLAARILAAPISLVTLVDRERLPYRRFSMAAQNRLRNYPWPGNVRELKNLVHRFLIMGGSDEVSLEEVEHAIGQEGEAPGESFVKQDLLALPLREAREAFEKAYLEQQLLLCEGRVGKLAQRVGMERTHLYRKLRSLGIDIKSIGQDD
jgi:DNA-binding NtrC family response regulator